MILGRTAVSSQFLSLGTNRNAPIALICRTGNRTTQVQRYLQSVGFTQVYNVREGMAGSDAGPGWVARKRPGSPAADAAAAALETSGAAPAGPGDSTDSTHEEQAQ